MNSLSKGAKILKCAAATCFTYYSHHPKTDALRHTVTQGTNAKLYQLTAELSRLITASTHSEELSMEDKREMPPVPALHLQKVSL